MKRYFALLIVICVAALRVLNCVKDEACWEEIQYEKEGHLSSIRQSILQKAAYTTRKFLPSPHSELALGMVVGADEFSKVPKFKQALKTTGLIHVVVVSGFNINLVYSALRNMLGSTYKLKNLVICEIGTFLYAFLTGLEPPVVRAWIMSSVMYIGKYYGRDLEVIPVVLFTAAVMVIITPRNISSLSFQLSFLATLGLILYEKKFQTLLDKLFRIKHFVISDLSSTLAAQVLVLPLISYNFGSISLISPIANMLTLWVVPIATIMGTLYIFAGFISVFITHVLFIPLYFLLDLFVWMVNLFSNISFAQINFSISATFLAGYYGVLFLMQLFKRKHER